MKLLTKFTLIFLAVFGTGLALSGVVAYRFLREDATEQVMQQARLMMQTMLSARAYTSKQVAPLLATSQEHERAFLPQTVPAYAATESFNYLRQAYPDYEYKEATLNPTNLRDRAVDWEADIINTFRNHSTQAELIGQRDTPTGRSLFLARPISADLPCLQCHDRARSAPPAMTRRYGTANGFGWKFGDVIAAQIVSVPMAVPIHMADAAFRNLMFSLAGIFGATLVLLDVLLYFAVVRPVSRLSSLADQISMGNFSAPELPAAGRDEIAALAGSFNRMRRSLEKALKMLDGQ
ncbi:putative sensor protein [Candidatus Sulfopaludibacter sp. SbA6]|nr:putative sensor protein [Candidatus Sulfopaludibacter sp. SbA6]